MMYPITVLGFGRKEKARNPQCIYYYTVKKLVYYHILRCDDSITHQKEAKPTLGYGNLSHIEGHVKEIIWYSL